MPPKRSSSRPHQLVQRRPRINIACRSCRKAKQRCEPNEYATNDRPCRRCVSQGLVCSIAQAARSQSPSAGFGSQGPGPAQHHIAPHYAGGATEELTPGSEINVQYPLQQSESPQVPMGRWSPLTMRSDERQGSSTNVPLAGQTPSQILSFPPLAPSMEGYQQQGFPNVAQGSSNLASRYYPQDYYGPTASYNTYMTSYATQSASDSAPNLGYIMEEPQPDNRGAFANEEDASPSRSDGS